MAAVRIGEASAPASDRKREYADRGMPQDMMHQSGGCKDAREKKGALQSSMSAVTIDSWGPALWRFLHAASFSYSTSPDWQQQSAMRQFLTSVGTILPCAICRKHYQEYITENLSDASVRSRETLIAWILELHNSVNRRTGKDEWSLERVKRVYDPEGGAVCNSTGSDRGVTTRAWATVVLVITLLTAVIMQTLRR